MEEQLNLKKFEKTRVRMVNKITITSSYSFGFPRKFFQDNNVQDYKYVVLYYDESNKILAFQFTNNEEESHKFTLIKSKQGYGAGVVATSFFKTYNLEPKTYRGKYNWEKKDIEGIGEVYLIKLKEREDQGKQVTVDAPVEV